VRQTGGSRYRGRVAWAPLTQQGGGESAGELAADTQTGGHSEITVMKEG
jgi:hypothetical protein